MGNYVGQTERSQHKYNCNTRCHAAQKASRATASENSLARTTENRAHAGALSCLQKYNEDHDQTDDNV
jgi:hypothetical protein